MTKIYQTIVNGSEKGASMKFTLAFLFFISMTPLAVAATPGVFAGMKGSKGAMLTPTFGLEKFIDGKRDDYEHQQWTLRCEEQPSKASKTQTDCSLERWLILDAEVKNESGAHIAVIQHSTSSGNLIVDQANWNGGEWKLRVLYEGGASMGVRFTLDTRRPDYFRITSFDGSVKTREGGVTTYRIPETTYFLKAAIRMEGMRDK